VVVYFEFWFVVSVQWMKCWFISSLFLIDRWLPLRHPRGRRMALLWRVAPSWLSDLTPGCASPFWPHGNSRVPWPPVPWVRAWTLWGPRGHPGSPLRPGHDGLVHHSYRRWPRVCFTPILLWYQLWQNHLRNEGFVSQDHIGGFSTKLECTNTHN
jgi:hypothetical protein